MNHVSHMTQSLSRTARTIGTALLSSAVLAGALSSQQRPNDRIPLNGALEALGSPRNPKVPILWDRWYDSDQLRELGERLARAHPDYVRVSSLGKSFGGKDITLITVTNFKVGDADKKPAMWIDGNIHSNEIQGSEFSIYTAWYLAEMAGQVAAVDTLLAQRTLYIAPTINPDARDEYLKQANTASSPRTGIAPRDNDGDGLIDEDGADDLNGDGHITQMRRRNPNGRFIESPYDKRILIPAPSGTKGEWDILGQEGIDNDGDGNVNEDGIGGYDPNRNWPWRWQPQYVQGGADWWPGSLPETRAVMNFVMKRDNIAGAQSYHNSGGMLLRGPGVPQDEYRPQDVAVYDQLGRTGEQILPGYRYMIVWKDLYTVWGGELDWFYGARGVLTFSNELFTSFLYFNRTSGDGRPGGQEESSLFDRLLLLGEAFVPWTKVQHPQYGEVEVGGFKKNFGRVEPGFLIQSDAHRNMMFTLYQTSEMPLVEVDSIATRSMGNGLTEVTAIVLNRKLAPTHTQQDVENKISRPDHVTLSGGKVVAAFRVTNTLQDFTEEQQLDPTTIKLANIPGGGVPVTVRWIVEGNGPFTVTVDSPKGGSHSMRSR